MKSSPTRFNLSSPLLSITPVFDHLYLSSSTGCTLSSAVSTLYCCFQQAPLYLKYLLSSNPFTHYSLNAYQNVSRLNTHFFLLFLLFTFHNQTLRSSFLISHQLQFLFVLSLHYYSLKSESVNHFSLSLSLSLSQLSLALGFTLSIAPLLPLFNARSRTKETNCDCDKLKTTSLIQSVNSLLQQTTTCEQQRIKRGYERSAREPLPKESNRLDPIPSILPKTSSCRRWRKQG